MRVETFSTKKQQLDHLYSLFNNCTNCPLGSLGRINVVFGSGNPDSKIVIIGEGPGAQEDLQGKPFVGRSGQLLTKVLEHCGARREDVYITNIVKCRPPLNRAPAPIEVMTCTNLLLKKQLSIIKPDIICTLGATAFTYFCGTERTISQSRGKVFTVKEYNILPTYHPAYLLRNPKMLPIFISDLEKVFSMKI